MSLGTVAAGALLAYLSYQAWQKKQVLAGNYTPAQLTQGNVNVSQATAVATAQEIPPVMLAPVVTVPLPAVPA